MSKTKGSAVPVIAAQIDKSPDSIGVFLMEYFFRQEGFTANGGFSTHFTAQGFVSVKEVLKRPNQTLARMAAVCLYGLALRGQGVVSPDARSADKNCDPTEAAEFLTALQKFFPGLRKMAAHEAATAKFIPTAQELGVTLAQFIEQNKAKVPENPVQEAFDTHMSALSAATSEVPEASDDNEEG